ncbi:hypothetical protein T492DRAFT_840544 [Pavlovales sp. CCMP2436]|nr:hypothetical protein T492DRAFT_840544 [Pavlovales sp. CCMP2436]
MVPFPRAPLLLLALAPHFGSGLEHGAHMAHVPSPRSQSSIADPRSPPWVSKQPVSTAACARTLAASSATAAARVTRENVVGREDCLRLTLNSSYQGVTTCTRGSFLHASLPMCLYYIAQGVGNYGTPTTDIGFLFTEPGALWRGPAWPQDSWGAQTSRTVRPNFRGSVRKKCVVDGPSSNDTRAAAHSYATRRQWHFKQDLGCGAKPAYATGEKYTWSRASVWRFQGGSNGCWHEHWPAAKEKQRALVDLIDKSGIKSISNNNAFFKLYNEVTFRFSTKQISAVYYVNTTSPLESNVKRQLTRARQALEVAFLAAHLRSSAVAAASGNQAELRTARLPVLEYRRGPGASYSHHQSQPDECRDGSAVNARIRSGLPMPPGLGFAPPAASELAFALESLRRQGLHAVSSSVCAA